MDNAIVFIFNLRNARRSNRIFSNLSCFRAIIYTHSVVFRYVFIMQIIFLKIYNICHKKMASRTTARNVKRRVLSIKLSGGETNLTSIFREREIFKTDTLEIDTHTCRKIYLATMMYISLSL